MNNLTDPKTAQAYFEAKMAFTTGPVELNRLLEQGDNITVIDVRMPEAYSKGHIPGAVNLPQASWADLTGLDKERLNIIYCYSHVCHLAARAAAEFAAQGFSVMEMEGGFKAWEGHQLKVDSAS